MPISAILFEHRKPSDPTTSTKRSKLDELEKLRMNKDEYDRVDRLHRTWYLRAVQSLMGAVGRELYLNMHRQNQVVFVDCLNKIEDDIDLKAGASCIIDAWDNKFTKKKSRIRRNHRSITEQKLGPQISNSPSSRNPETSNGDAKFNITNMAEVPKLLSPEKLAPQTPFKALATIMTNSIRASRAGSNETLDNPGKGSYNQLKQLNHLLEAVRDTKNYRRRMLDIVTDGDKSVRKPTQLSDRIPPNLFPAPEKVPPLLRSLYTTLLDEINNHNGSQLSYQLLSPKFASLVRDRNLPNEESSSKNQLLSPNLFPLYNPDADTENSDADNHDILPVPKLLEAAGFSRDDKSAALELIMEASGASELVSDAMKLVKDQGSKLNLMDDIEGVTGLVANKFRELKNRITPRQHQDLDKRKYTFMDKDQMDFMYSDKALFPGLPSELPHQLFGYGKNWTESDRLTFIKDFVHSMAGSSKVKRQSNSGSGGGDNAVEEEKLQGGVILSPFAFSPTVLQLTVLGPIILSPSVFSPAILGPAVLSPPILSPQVGNPLILSPYVLGPNILSAAVFNPYVLSPYVLSPNILNPYVLSPLILSPHVLSPDILSPTVLSGTILNPYVMSPAILSDSIIGVNILSPSVLS
ncbi:moulting cycle domain-containing protein [Ditylenchus destructor]|nr:moulting cycle domain-containing protein [Ditylenchus destructor]